MKKIKKLGLLLIVLFSFMIGNNVVKGEQPFYNITGLYFNTDEVEAGGRLYVDLYMGSKDSSTKIEGYFGNGKGSNITLQLKDINTKNPYFEMSNYMTPGETYTMSKLIVEDSKDTITYSMTSNGTNPYMNPLGKNVVKIKNTYMIKALEFVDNKVVKSDGRLTIKFETNIDFQYVSIVARNKKNPISTGTFYIYEQSDGLYYINLTKGSDKLIDGDYYISDVFIMGGPSSVHFSSYSVGNGIVPLNITDDFTIKNEEEPEVLENPKDVEFLKSITISSTNAKLNEKVNVLLETEEDLTSATLIFSNSNESMTVNVKDLNSSNSYFVVPFTTNAGVYNLDYAILKDANGNEYQYRKAHDYYTVKHFNFSSYLKVVNEVVEGNILNIDNSKMSAEILQKLKELEANIVIDINANDNPIISKDLFEAIKDSNKTIVIKYKDLEWTFNGLDVKTPKQIDVSTNIYNVSDDDSISLVVDNGFVLDFADNDDLPGKCLIKLYNSDTIAKVMNKNDANIYYYNEQTNKFEIIELNSEYNSEGYYEFYISHNSKYVVTTEKIDEEHVTESNNKTDEEKENETNREDLVLYVAIGALIVAVLALLIVAFKKK